MRQIEDAFNEYFCGCDINKRRDRIGVIAVMLTRYNDYDIREIRKELNFTSLRYHRLDDMIESIGLPACNLCTYCFNGKE